MINYMYNEMSSPSGTLQREAAAMNDVTIIFIDLPTTVRSFVKSNSDQSYTVVINSKLSAEMQRNAYRHELEHIESGDYEKDVEADLIEIRAHHEV